jgi:Replication protein A OB domain
MYCTVLDCSSWWSSLSSSSLFSPVLHTHVPNFLKQDSILWGAPPDFCCCLHQALVDLLGVVTTVGPLGSVKRKSDQSELQRRDITLLDSRLDIHMFALCVPSTGVYKVGLCDVQSDTIASAALPICCCCCCSAAAAAVQRLTLTSKSVSAITLSVCYMQPQDGGADDVGRVGRGDGRPRGTGRPAAQHHRLPRHRLQRHAPSTLHACN